MMKTRIGFLTSTLLAAVCWPSPNLRAQFPGLGDDTTTSLGQFKLVVNPSFQPFVTNSPGWNPSTSRFWSPTLYDPGTEIGRSDPFLSGSAADTGGAPVGRAGTVVSDGSFSLVPPGFQPQAGTREVHTELRALALMGGGVNVRAGTNASGQPLSVGSVNSLSSSGLPANDFPAQGFFDIFMELDVPGLGTLSNSTPLIVLNTNLTSFPPRVVYVHGNSLAVPFMFEADNPLVGAHAGDIFGLLLLAGHGVSMGSNDIASFQTNIQMLTEMQVLPQYQTWAPNLRVAPMITSIALFGGGDLLIQGQGASRSEYVLETSTTIAPGAWVSSGLVVLANSMGNFALTYPGPLLDPQRFFRMRSR